MQKRQGYCSYCRVQYSNLEQHLFSAQHRSLTRQSRRRTTTNNSLMERFLQDVLRHHPYNYQDSRSAPNEAAADPEAPEVVVLDDSDEKEDDPAESAGGMYSEDSESVEEIDCRPGTSRERAEVAVRPSVIQKLERGQQQSLELAHKVESGVKKVNSVGVVQATTSGKKLVRPPVICNAPASSLPRGSFERPVAATSVPRLVLAVASDSFPACDTESLETYFDPPEQGSSSQSPQPKSKDPKKKPLTINLDKLLAQKNLRAKGASFSPVVRVRELTGPELCSVRVESSSELGAGAAVSPSETNTPPEENREGAIPKRREASRSNAVRPQEETHLILNKPTVLRQRCSVSSEVKCDHGSLQSVPGHSQAADDLSLLEEEKEEQEEEEEKEEEEVEGNDQEDETYESRGSEMSFDCGSSCQSLSALSELTAREINVSEEAQADTQPGNGTPTVSGATSDNSSSSHQVTANHSQVITQNIQLISLVDESYESSGSEVNFEGDDSLPSTSHRPPQPVKAASLPTQMPVRLVDKSYGSGSSEPCEDSGSSVDETPAAAGQQRPLKNAHAHLVDDNYGSSSFSSDSDAAQDRPQMPVQERSPEDRAVEQESENQPTSAEVHPERDGSLETVADEPQREAEEINLPNQKNTGLGDMNCESHGPEMGFHADAQLEADQSPVNPEEVDVDLENQSVHSGISNLSFDSHASYQSANDQPQGAWGEVNLDELNVDMEVKSSGCSSSELTFDSDSPLLSVTERSLLDIEGINEDDFNLEDESCVSSSSDITFDSDIPDDSVADQPQVAVYEEEPVDLENKSNESCVSEITFDSGIPLHSGNDHPEVAVKEVIIQKEENVHLEGKNDNPSGSEICLDSNAPLHSVTNSEVAVKKINPPKEEQVHIKQKENEPTDSELSLDCDTSNSKPGRLQDPIVLPDSETKLGSHTRFQSVIRKCEVIVKNVCLQKEKHVELPNKSLESHSEISSASTASQPVTEPYVGKKAKRKTKHLEEVKSDDEYGGSQPAFKSGVCPQSVTGTPQPAALTEGHADPKDKSPELRGVEVTPNTAGCLDSVISQPQLASKENHVELKDTNGKPSDSKASGDSVGHFHSLPKPESDVITKMNQWKKEAKVLEKKISELIYSKLMYDSNVSFRSAMDQLELALKQISLDSNDQMPLEDNCQDTCSETNLNSDLSVQSVVEQLEVTVLEPEHVELEGRNSESCDSKVNFDSNDSLQSEANQHGESGENTCQKDKDDLEGKRDEAQGFGITGDSSVPQSLAGQTEVVQEINHWKDHVDLEDKIVESSGSKINVHSDELLQCVSNTTQEPVQETDLLRGPVSPNDNGCEPCGSGIVSVSNVIFCSVIQKPQRLQKGYTSLKVKNSSCGPELSVDSHAGPEISVNSSDPCQSVAGHLQKSAKKINLKEDHIYLEDKSYKLVDFEPTYDSDDTVQFVTDPSVADVSIKEVNLAKENQDGLENENFQPCCSKVTCSSGVHLQSDIDPPQGACKEAGIEKKERDIEEKCNVSCESEIVYDSDVSFQIVVNQLQTSDGETDSPQVVFVDVVSSDSDCDREVISDSTIPLQVEAEPPQMTVKETNDVNTDSVGSVALEKYYCKFCGCEYEASQSVTNQSKESFKIINRKNDYIILGDSTCPSCGHELHFNVDASVQPTTCHLRGPSCNRVGPKDKKNESHCTKRKYNLVATIQPVTHQLQRTGEDSLWKDPTSVGFQARSWESVSCAADRRANAVSVIRQTVVKDNPWRLAGTVLETVSSQTYGSILNFQYNAPVDSDFDQPQPAKKLRQRKKVTFDLRVTKYEYVPSVYSDDGEEYSELETVSEVLLKLPPLETEEFSESDPDEPVSEASLQVPPSEVEEFSESDSDEPVSEASLHIPPSEVEEISESDPDEPFPEASPQIPLPSEVEEISESDPDEPVPEASPQIPPPSEAEEISESDPDEPVPEASPQVPPPSEAEEISESDPDEPVPEASPQIPPSETEEFSESDPDEPVPEASPQIPPPSEAEEISESDPDEPVPEASPQIPPPSEAEEFSESDPDEPVPEASPQVPPSEAEEISESDPDEPVPEASPQVPPSEAEEISESDPDEPVPEASPQIPSPSEAEEFSESDPDEPFPEASPQVPPSSVRKMSSQMREDDVRTNTQEYQSHIYRCYDGDTETKKIFLREEVKTTWSDFKRNTPPSQSLSRLKRGGKVRDTSDFSVPLGKASCSVAEGLHQQRVHVASQNQVEGVRGGTQTSSVKKRKFTVQQEESRKRKHLPYDSQKKKKGQTATTVPVTQTNVSEPEQPDSLVYIFSSLSMKEDQSLNPPIVKPVSGSSLRFIYSFKERNIPGPPRKQTVINPPASLTVPEVDTHKTVGVDLRSDPESSAGENGANRQSMASTSSTTVPKRSVLRFHGTSQSSSFPENSKDAGATEVSKDNFQQTLLNCDGAKNLPETSQKEDLENKSPRKYWKKKITAAYKSSIIKNAYKTVVLRKRSKLASEKLAIWIQMKATDVVRKYVSRCHGVRRKHQSKTVLIRMRLRKKRIVARKIKEAKRAAEARSSTPVLPAAAEEQSSTPAEPAEPPAHLPDAAGIKKYRKTYYRRKKRLFPVREYDLRSSAANTDRMVTRLASKSKSNEAK